MESEAGAGSEAPTFGLEREVAFVRKCQERLAVLSVRRAVVRRATQVILLRALDAYYRPPDGPGYRRAIAEDR